jgi:predicted glycosyltransferase
MRLVIYSHDTFGLGNIRRSLVICKYLSHSIAGLSTLIVTGSPMLHRFRIPDGVDYIKLPCLKRNETGDLAVSYVKSLEVRDIVAVRRDTLFSVMRSFAPDLLLVDKKPAGLAGELIPSIEDLKFRRPNSKVVLLLRDILDSPSQTVKVWKQQRHYELLANYYDAVLVLGERYLFDVCTEYQFPPTVCALINYCGYIARERSVASREEVRRQLGVSESAQLVVVTTGGGEDGYDLIHNYLSGLQYLPSQNRPTSLVITGPELDASKQAEIHSLASQHERVQIIEFTDDMMAYLDAADVVVSMGGYNTICEILSIRKRAIIVPRVRPVCEQLIRAERMAARGLFRTIHPDRITPEILMKEVSAELSAARVCLHPSATINMDALPRIAALMDHWRRTDAFANYVQPGLSVGAGA